VGDGVIGGQTNLIIAFSRNQFLPRQVGGLRDVFNHGVDLQMPRCDHRAGPLPHTPNSRSAVIEIASNSVFNAYKLSSAYEADAVTYGTFLRGFIVAVY